jgi:transposase
LEKKECYLRLDIQRLKCKRCGKIRQVNIGFANERFGYTRQFENLVLSLCEHMTIKDVSVYLKVSWDVIKDIQKRYLKKHYGKPILKDVTRIAIDEISIGKGHKYLTIVLDLETGVVIHVGKGKGTDALSTFWKRLKRSKAKIEAVAIDMSPAYINAITGNLPEAVIVFDHFHVIKMMNDKISSFRRGLYRKANAQEKTIIKGTRWLLLKNPENLDEKKDEKLRLERALALNEPLKIVYYMKEDIRQFWNQSDKKAAEGFLQDWIDRAAVSGIGMLINFAKTLKRHWQGLISYYDYPISTGPLEGTNNKIKTMKRQAYGYRDSEFFKLKIYAIHKTRYALVG